MTIKTDMRGTIDSTLTAFVRGDHYGAQILDVVFYSDEYITEVTPTSGTYSVQWSANGNTWNDFDGTQFPASVLQPVNDWQASGYIDSVRAVPVDIIGATHWKVRYRSHRFGLPGALSSSMSSTRYFSAMNSVQIGAFEFSVLQGAALSTSKPITLEAGAKMSIRLDQNVNSVVSFSTANGLFISYVDGAVSGDLIDLSSSYRLNTLEPRPFQSSFEYYNGPAVGNTSLSEKDRVETPFITTDGGVIELTNKTSETISTIFSCAQTALSVPVVPYMLTANTELVGSTDMGLYNGSN